MKRAHESCQLTAGHRSALISYATVVGTLLATATAPSYGQLTVSQISYVKIPDAFGNRQTNASQLITSIPGGQSISFGAVDSASVSSGQLIGSFEYFSSVLGSGTARYGSLGGKIETNSSSTPDSLPFAFGPGNAINFGSAQAHGYTALTFQDTGVVTSSTLAVGTPVTLSFTFSLESFGYLVGRPTNSDNRFLALYMPSATDISANPVTGTSTLVADNGIQTLSLNTVVGHTLRLNGELDIYVQAWAGRDNNDAPYYSQVMGGEDASNTAHYFLDAPAGVSFASASGHDYSVTPGDYNTNGIVDAADYTVWRNGLGSIYTPADYDVWKSHFGQMADDGSGSAGTSSSRAAVPEPTTVASLLVGILAVFARGRVKRSGIVATARSLGSTAAAGELVTV